MKISNQHVIYGDALFDHKPTLKFLIWHYLYNKFINTERHKQVIYRDKAYFLDKSITMEGLQVKHLAIIVDNKVVEILKMKSETADLIKSTSNQFIEFDPKTTLVKIGMTYDGDFKNEKKD